MRPAILTVTLLLLACLALSESAKILGLFTTFSRSHLIVHKAAIQPLIDNGHDVTIVSTLSIDETDKKYRHILLDVPPPPKEFLTGIIKGSTGPLSLFSVMMTATGHFMQYSNASLQDPKMQKLMAEESFDLLVYGYVFNTFQLGVAAHFKCPVVLSFMQRPLGFVNDIVGNPHELMIVPHIFVGHTQPMGFFDRVKNVLAQTLMDGVFLYLDWKMEKFYEYNFPSDKYPSYAEMKKNVSLVLTNFHFSNGIVRPNVPALVEIGGIQVKPNPDPLPEDIKKFLDGASKDGAVYFSLGSNARSADMGSETISMLYNALASLKQRVIWKWEEDATPGNASNILFKRWLPQDDILAHPNIKLFVTHGGHGSVVESEYHGVPMVGMPLFADQFSNMDAVQKAGYGLSLGKGDITEEKFRNAVKEVLENPSYRNKVQEFSRLYRDRPMSPRDTAAFWLEYVIRHRGAKHMQSPAVHMNFIQYYGIDVFAFLFAIVYVVFKTIAFVLKRIYRLVFGSKGKKSKRE